MVKHVVERRSQIRAGGASLHLDVESEERRERGESKCREETIDVVREVLGQVVEAVVGATASTLCRKGGASVSVGAADEKERKRPHLARPRAEHRDGSNGVIVRQEGGHVQADPHAETGAKVERKQLDSKYVSTFCSRLQGCLTSVTYPDATTTSRRSQGFKRTKRAPVGGEKEDSDGSSNKVVRKHVAGDGVVSDSTPRKEAECRTAGVAAATAAAAAQITAQKCREDAIDVVHEVLGRVAEAVAVSASALPLQVQGEEGTIIEEADLKELPMRSQGPPCAEDGSKTPGGSPGGSSHLCAELQVKASAKVESAQLVVSKWVL